MRIPKETVILIILLTVFAFYLYHNGGLPSCSVTLPNFDATDHSEIFNNEWYKPYSEEAESNMKVFSSKREAIDTLNSLEIADADDSPYGADIRNNQYGGWKDIKGWSTRDEVLSLTAQNAEKSDTAFISGTWNSPYTGQDIECESKTEVAKNIQIDHIIPIAYVNRHGGYSWDEDKKKEYYNDYGVQTDWTVGANDTNDYEKCGVLLASDYKSNIQKSDKGPSEWMPSNESYRQEYCERWVKIASVYGISITQSDYDTLLHYLQAA